MHASTDSPTTPTSYPTSPTHTPTPTPTPTSIGSVYGAISTSVTMNLGTGSTNYTTSNSQATTLGTEGEIITTDIIINVTLRN